jgi:hypothetical protein
MNTLPIRTTPAVSTARALAASVLAVACGAAGAQGDEDEPASAAPRFEVTAEPVARLDGVQPSTRIEAIGWAAGDVHAFGVAVGSQTDRVSVVPWQSPQAENSLNIGLRWRSTLNDRRRVDVAAWRQVAAAADERPGVTTRIEMQFTSPRSSVGLSDLGAIGMQLDGNAKLQLKIRRGKPMFYYRSKF